MSRSAEVYQDEMDARQQSGEEEYLAYEHELERAAIERDIKREEQFNIFLESIK